MFVKAAATIAILASTAAAHFKMTYPPTRGNDYDKQPEFCGGFTTPQSPRNEVPLNGNTPIYLSSGHSTAAVAILISDKQDPKNFDDFSKTLAKNWFGVPQGTGCFNVDFSKVDGLDLKNGSQVTIQMQYEGGDGSLYQCSDLVLVDNAEIPSNWTCQNDVSLASNATVTATPSVGDTSKPKETDAPGAGEMLKPATAGLLGSLALMIAALY